MAIININEASVCICY